MRIDDDERKISREKRIDLIRRYQDEQAKLDQGGGKEAAKLDQKKLDQTSSSEVVRELQKTADRTQDATKADEVKSVDKRGEIQATELHRDVQRTEGQRQVVDGVTKSAEAVSAAQKQQTRGENWQKFEAHDRGDLPQSVEEKARAEKAAAERDDVERQEKERLSVRELLNDMAVKQKMIRS
jgi:hypothetical protein